MHPYKYGHSRCLIVYPYTTPALHTQSYPTGGTHHEVELLRLLLVGPPLGHAGLAEVCLGHGRLDRLGGAAVVETLRHIVVLNGHHVLDGGQGSLRGLLDLKPQTVGEV